MRAKKKITAEPLMKLKDGGTTALKKKVLFVWPDNPNLANDKDGRVYKKIGNNWVYEPE